MANFKLADQREIRGFLSPPMWKGDLCDLQPAVFVSTGGYISFYQSLRRLAEKAVQDLERTLLCKSSSIFPVTYDVDSSLVSPGLSGAITGVGFRENGVAQYL